MKAKSLFGVAVLWFLVAHSSTLAAEVEVDEPSVVESQYISRLYLLNTLLLYCAFENMTEDKASYKAFGDIRQTAAETLIVELERHNTSIHRIIDRHYQ